VLVLHALLWWAISSGLARQVVRMTENTVEAVLMSEAPPPAPAAPPPPTPKTPAPPPPAPTSTAPAITQTNTPPAAAPTAPAIRTGAVIQAGASCAKPDYPSASRRLEEEGTVILKFLIGVEMPVPPRHRGRQARTKLGHHRLQMALGISAVTAHTKSVTRKHPCCNTPSHAPRRRFQHWP
jgi:hypothetical protein